VRMSSAFPDCETLKVYICPSDNCGRTFTRRSGRADHVRRLHLSLAAEGTFGGEAVKVTKQDIWKTGDGIRGFRLRPSLMEKFQLNQHDNGVHEVGEEVRCINSQIKVLKSQVEELYGMIQILVETRPSNIKELVEISPEDSR